MGSKTSGRFVIFQCITKVTKLKLPQLYELYFKDVYKSLEPAIERAVPQIRTLINPEKFISDEVG